MSSRNRRQYLKGIGVVGSVALAGCSGGGDGAGGDGSGGGDSGDGSDQNTQAGTPTSSGPSAVEDPHIGFVNMGFGGSWLRTFELAFQWWCEDNGYEYSITRGQQAQVASQVNRALDLIRGPADGLIISPVDSKALVEVVKEGQSQNVPVFTANSTAATGDVGMFTAFGNGQAAAKAGRELASLLRDSKGGGQVAELVLPQRSQTFQQRHRGFADQIANEDSVEITNQLRISNKTADVVQKLTPVLQRNEDIDAIYAPDNDTGLGAVEALRNADMLAPAGEDGHKMIAAIDASHAALENIQNGIMDLAIDQPNIYYGPITAKYLTDYLESGYDDSVLPEPGSEVTADDLGISGSEHLGVDVWQEPIWAPADVTTNEYSDGEQLYFRTNALTITQDSDVVDAPWIWGNLSQREGF